MKIISNENIESMRENAIFRRNKKLEKEIINFDMLSNYSIVREKLNIKETEDILLIHLDNETFDKIAKNKKTYTDDDEFIYYYNKIKKVLFLTIKDHF